MKLKTHNYTITVTYTPSNSAVSIKSVIIIKAISVNRQQALKIARILFPNTKVSNVQFHL